MNIAPDIEQHKEPVILPCSGVWFERHEVKIDGFTMSWFDGWTEERIEQEMKALLTGRDCRPFRSSIPPSQDFRVLLLGGHDFVGSGRNEEVSYPDEYTPSNRPLVLEKVSDARYQHNPQEALPRLAEVYINSRLFFTGAVGLNLHFKGMDRYIYIFIALEIAPGHTGLKPKASYYALTSVGGRQEQLHPRQS